MVTDTTKIKVATKYVPTEAEAILIEEIVIFLFMAIQVVFYILQKRYPMRFQEVTLVFLWLFPFTFIYYQNFNLVSTSLIFFWAIWSMKTIVILKKAMKKELGKDTPGEVYNWFLMTHEISYFISSISLYTFLFIPTIPIISLFISLYIGVLGRDCAEVASQRISSKIGYLQYEQLPSNLCALCGNELDPNLFNTLEGSDMYEDEVEQDIKKLGCGHEFHSACIRGWTILGKRDSCPFCKEKVYFEDILPEGDRPWNSRNLNICYIWLLSCMRYLLVWLPIVSNSISLFLKIMGLNTERMEAKEH
eukprot:maker-scaffold_7-snap-gene-11.43-mRNA-1 protein AED:0.01 eAED:0.01 QI:45/1/1/1/1/1/2/83/304